MRSLLAFVAVALVVTAAAAEESAVEKGRYIVENVAMCGECHTPRRDDGELARERWLEGAPVPVERPAFAPSWAIEAPRIAGLGTYDDVEALRLFIDGIARNGRPLRPPMPRYRFAPADARAVLAYLRALR